MTPNEYVKNAVRTKSDTFLPPTKTNPEKAVTAPSISIDVLHAIVGISTEAGEMMDVAKKNMFYGKLVDYVNLDEEIGDVLWYVAIYCNARGIDIGSLMQTNINKLRSRFPERFTQHGALNRNLAAEREILERKPVCPECSGAGQRINADGKTTGCLTCGRT